MEEVAPALAILILPTDAKTKPKPYQKQVLFCGMVLIWFWFGLEPNQNHIKTIPNGYVYARTHVPVMGMMVL